MVEAVRRELARDPLLEVRLLRERVNERLGRPAWRLPAAGRSDREDLSEANLEAALDQISCEELRRGMGKQLDRGEAHYKEAYLLEEMMTTLSSEAGEKAGWVSSVGEDPMVSDPTAIRKLLTPGGELAEISSALQWICRGLTFYYWGVPLSRLGMWLGVHKTTVLRWMLGLVVCLWPVCCQAGRWCMVGSCRRFGGGSPMRMRRGSSFGGRGTIGLWSWMRLQRFRWGIFSLRVGGGGCACLLPAWRLPAAGRSDRQAGRWLGVRLQGMGIRIKALCTDGLAGDAKMLPEIPHLWGHFHHQQGVTAWLKEHFSKGEVLQARKQAMKQVLHRQRQAHGASSVGQASPAGLCLGDCRMGSTDDGAPWEALARGRESYPFLPQPTRSSSSFGRLPGASRCAVGFTPCAVRA